MSDVRASSEVTLTFRGPDLNGFPKPRSDGAMCFCGKVMGRNSSTLCPRCGYVVPWMRRQKAPKHVFRGLPVYPEDIGPPRL